MLVKQPTFTANGFEDKNWELGDIAFDIAVGKTWESKWVTLGGIFGSAPTATDESLGLNEWTLGPNVFVGKNTSWGFFGLLISHSWGLSGNDGSSITAGQYFYTVNLGNAWQIQAQPTYSFNHKGKSGSKWTLPLSDRNS